MAHTIATFDRPTNKENGLSSPAYSEAQIAARKAIGEQIGKLIQDNLSEIGAFVTPNNNHDGLLVSVNLSCPSLSFVTDSGAEQKTRPFVLNVNASVTTVKDTPAQAEVVAAMTYDELLASLKKRAKK